MKTRDAAAVSAVPAPANDNGASGDARGGSSVIDLRCGDWREVLADVECAALICDPPYSERTHSGHNEGSALGDARVAAEYERTRRLQGKRKTQGRGVWTRRKIDYQHWSAADVRSFVDAWEPRTHGWFVALTDHVLAPAWEAALEACGRYVFAPLQAIAPGSRVRLSGDGPAQWSTTIVVARPATREFQRWGSLPGGYVVPQGSEYNRPHDVIGGKHLWLMRALAHDYSRPGDLICDPCAGGGTTLLAAAIEGRRAIGAELDPKTHALAMKRIARGYTPLLRFGDADADANRRAPVQQDLYASAASTAAGEVRQK